MMNKKYKTKLGGMPARIVCDDVKNNKNFPVLALITTENGEEMSMHLTDELTYYPDARVSRFDLVEVSQWDHLKIDQPVWVKKDGAVVWNKRHFGGVKDGRPSAWNLGYTSFTCATDGITIWDECLTVEEYEALPENEK